MEKDMHPGSLQIDDFDYPLPEGRIAQFPLENRDNSRLLIYNRGQVGQDLFFNISRHLPGESLMVFNETRVVHARLVFSKPTGSRVELFCLEPLSPFRDHQRAFAQTMQSEWLCLVGNSKRWKSGTLEMTIESGNGSVRLSAERSASHADGTSRVRLSWDPPGLTFSQILESAGNIPLPPYIRRVPVRNDELTYQTIYARQEGSVAAPTAGLHFTPHVFGLLQEKKIDTLNLILHVGAGTFKPVSSGRLEGHQMHAEQVIVPLESLEKLRNSFQKNIIAVGTTTTRLLESLYWHGVKVIKGLSDPQVMDVRQWDPYDPGDSEGISREAALDAILEGCRKSNQVSVTGKTSLMIAPGYRFRYPDILVTNFHQPKSTLLLLIAAFIGDDWKKAYDYALANDFRFLSYGDSCLFFRKTQ